MQRRIKTPTIETVIGITIGLITPILIDYDYVECLSAQFLIASKATLTNRSLTNMSATQPTNTMDDRAAKIEDACNRLLQDVYELSIANAPIATSYARETADCVGRQVGRIREALMGYVSNDEILLTVLEGCGCKCDLVWCTACANSLARKVRDGKPLKGSSHGR